MVDSRSSKACRQMECVGKELRRQDGVHDEREATEISLGR